VNFDLTEDQAMLKALAERFVEDRYDIERRRAYQGEPAGFSARNWELLGELGLIAAPFAEQDGGMGLDVTGIATVFEAFGHGLVVEPLIENVLVAARLFAATAPEPLRSEWLPELVAGRRRIALVHAEPGNRGGYLSCETRAEPGPAGMRLTGRKTCVPAGVGADGFIVSARARDGRAPGLFFVPAAAEGLALAPWRLVDGTAALTVELHEVPAAAALRGGVEQIAATQALASVARSAEALGLMKRMFAETLDYLRTREQFGAKLGSFQAIQHRMVAQYAAIEQSRGLLNLALVSRSTPEFARAVDGARSFISAASIALAHEMVQFHGGMGVTDEIAISHAHKRLFLLSRWPDDAEAALDRFAGIAAAA
jgi:alkylation response protein AidB-like acyl-CoA dehydrogenase